MSAQTPALLIVEDDLALQKQLKWSMDRFESVTADDVASAVLQFRRHKPPVVTMDLGLPPDQDSVSEGFKLLEKLIELEPGTKVIVLTGQNDQSNALRAIRMGAYDFLAKPVDPDVLVLTVERALRLHELQQENQRLLTQQDGEPTGRLLTRDPQMQRLCRTVERVAGSDATVLLLGESGTGKEVLAQSLHDASKRKGRFVAINCAAIPEALLESELFGYERGAFTGATKTTVGKIETAHGGTLMLDEIGDLPMPLQAKLLRFLQERSIERLGGRQEIDAAFLQSHAFLRRFSSEQRRPILRLADDAIRAVEAHRWPGNVRELQNLMKRASIMADGERITADDLNLPVPGGDAPGDEPELDLRAVRERAERQAVVAALARTDGNIAKAADLLGVSRPTLYDLMARLGVKA